MTKQERKELKDQIKYYNLNMRASWDNTCGAFYFYIPPNEEKSTISVTKTEEIKLQNGKIMLIDYHLEDIIGIEII